VICREKKKWTVMLLEKWRGRRIGHCAKKKGGRRASSRRRNGEEKEKKRKGFHLLPLGEGEGEEKVLLITLKKKGGTNKSVKKGRGELL